MEHSLPFLISFATYVYISHGCTMQGVTQWLAPQQEFIMDTHRGLIIERSTSDIEDINRIDFGDGLNRRHYLEISLENSIFTVTTTDAFADYEEYETLLAIRVTTNFRCTGGTFRPLTFVFNINDTNNHAPVFIPTDNYDFPLALPVPPGFNVTNCEYIVVRDVDLTTRAIEFGIDDNPYFNIIYSRQIQPKEFGAFINTKKLIRSTRESLSYQISATDVDETNDDPLTSYAMVNILADNEFRLPDEPIFSKAFYKANYTEDHDLILREYISLRQGYDDQVIFDLEGVYADYFELVDNNNDVSFRVKSPLPSNISETQIFLVVKAEREFTSGATATVLVLMPEEVDVMFESPLYEGEIEDNELRAPNLILAQGYEEVQEIEIISEHASYFTAIRLENTIRLRMNPLPAVVIQSNNVLNLQVVASAHRSSAVCVVALEIIKDDYITPVFEKTIYYGNYNPETGLSIESIVLLQGYDSTVVIDLTGEHKNYFQVLQEDAIINLTASIPVELWSEGSLIVTVEATKPRTVSANTAVLVNLPAARELMFEAASYSGYIKNNVMMLENIVLSVGYAEDVRFELSGTFANYFTTNTTINVVTISLQTNLPDDVISENSALMLMLTASGLNTLDTSTNILLNIVKNDYITPVFEHALYNGTYDPVTGLTLQDLVIFQGYDETVEISLNGEHAESFVIKQEGQNISLNGSVPPDIWFERYLLLIIHATKPLTVGANAAIQIKLPEARVMNFKATKYVGNIMNNTIDIEEIVLSIGYTTDVQFQIIGEYAQYFTVRNTENNVSIDLNVPLPDSIILENNFIVLTVSASGLNAVSASTLVLLEILKSDTTTPVFNQHIYMGIYWDPSNVEIENITLVQGFDDTVIFHLDGDHAQYFEIDNVENEVKISLKSEIPEELIFTEKTLLFKILAEKEFTVGASAIVSVQFPRELTEPTIMRFSKNSYLGSLNDTTFEVIDHIVLDSGFRNGTRFILSGAEYAEHFAIKNVDNIISITMLNSAPVEELKNNNFIILQVEAHRERAVSVSSALVVDIVPPDIIIFPVFEKPFYSGNYTIKDGLQFEQEIRLAAGFDNTVTFELEGDASQWFFIQKRDKSVAISRNESLEIPSDVIELNHQLLFSIVAHKPGTIGGRSAISITLLKDHTEQVILRFQENNYVGKIEDGTVHLPPLFLNKDIASVEFRITGDHASYFSIEKKGSEINIDLSSYFNIDEVNTSFIVLTVEASHVEAMNGYTTVVLQIADIEKSVVTPVFEKPYYMGEYTRQRGLTFDHTIRLVQGFDDSVLFSLEGDNSIWFALEQRAENSVGLILKHPLTPAVLANNRNLIFIITATRSGSVTARTTVVILLNEDTQVEVTFDKIMYNGFLRLGEVTHELITIKGYNGASLKILGQYAEFFEANISNQEVRVSTKPTSVLPNVAHIALELHAGGASTVLLLTVLEPETPELPTVTFDSPSYVLRIDVTHTGLVGRVRASADNGETVVYSLLINNANLQGRLSVNSNGELWLSAPAPSGAYFLQLIATTVITRVTGNAPVHLVVEAVTVCGDNIVVPPLIILDRDEEEPHRNLVVLNQTAFVGCQFDLSNSWPENQPWLYVDSEGLHAHAIDREHESIAFMALSQIQVELTLRCESDTTSRSKRSLNLNPRLDWLGPYEYGSNKWILTDSIPYNTRRSFVNLIVNDINDNAPIFVGKDNEPIAVGYPIQSLEKIILPRALAELKATDADIGENAALVYWSLEDSISVSSSTGFVHVRNHFNLENNTRLIIQATDQKGAGLTGSLELVVRLLEKDHIAVLTIRNAFLDDEELILRELSKTVGYEVKTLRTIVISESEPTRSKRETSESEQVLGASLQLFVYGLIERQPVEVNQLITDIKNSNVVTVNVASTISLEDHLDGNETCVLLERDIGLLVATIVLCVLLFILLLAIAVWFLIRKFRNKYEKFSDKNSLASQNGSIEEPKSDIISKPRLNIEELRKSERRLQERLRVPIVDVSDEPTTSEDKPFEAIINISTPEPNLPIVIQTIDKLKDKSEESDDNDEFGEIKKSRRKSVVTFNENVEKIIHLEDSTDSPDSDYEIYRF